MLFESSSKTMFFLLAYFQNVMLSRSLNQCYDSTCCNLEETLSHNNIIDQQCFTGSGHNYRGRLNYTNTGRPCISWMNTAVFDMPLREKAMYGIGEHNFCRNPDPTGTNKPWCYVSPRNYGYCKVNPCSETAVSIRNKKKLTDFANNDASKTHQNALLFPFNDSLNFVIFQPYAEQYLIYKFHKIMTSFKEPFEQALEDAFHLCITKNDDITFVTSDHGNMTYFYMQQLNLLLRVDFKKRGWEVVDHVIVDSCLVPVLRLAMVNETHQTKIRSVFSFNDPYKLILLTPQHLSQCEWRNGTLVLVFQEEFPSAQYVKSDLIIINQKKFTYAFVMNRSGMVLNKKEFHNKESTTNLNSLPTNHSSYVTVAEDAITIYPGLAGLMMGYKILNNNTLLKLYDVNESLWSKPRDLYCPRAGNKSRLMRVNNGMQLVDLIQWLKYRLKYSDRSKIEVDVKLHAAYLRRSTFCQYVSNGCCYVLQRQFETIRSSDAFAELLQRNDKISWIKCRLHFDNATDCPDLSCFNESLVANPATSAFAACEIKIAPDPPQRDLSLDDILGTSDERTIRYENVHDASNKIGQIADSLRSSNHPTKLGLRLLISSIEALKPLNYDELQKSKTKVFIHDFLFIVNNLADEKRVEDWVNVKSNEDTEKNQYKSREQNQNFELLFAKDPHSLLFLTENILERVASKQNILKNSADVLVVETKNVISTVKLKYVNENISSSFSRDTSYNVTITSPSVDPNLPAVVVTSLFPSILQMITSVSKGISDGKNETFIAEFDWNTEKESYPLPNSPVLSTSVLQNNTKLQSAVRFELPFSKSNLPNPQKHDQKFYLSCSYLTSNNTWDTRGCRVMYYESKNDSVQCICNHTTNFAIILQVVKPKIGKADLTVLKLISYIGETLSTFCLIVALSILGMFRQSLKSDRIVAHSNLIIALILFHLVQLFSYMAEKWKDISPSPCITVAFVSHFSLLSAFMWMLCEGITLHFSVVDVFNTNSNFKVIRYFIGWGIPLAIASSTLAYGLLVKPFPTCYLQGVGEYSCFTNHGEEAIAQQSVDPEPNNQLIEKCWLSINNYLVLALFVPAVIVLVLNTALMIRVSLLISESSKATNRELRPSSENHENKFEHFRKSLKGVVILMPILGVPWIFGIIPQAITHVVFLYAFTLLNSTQGVFLLLFYCILNNEVRSVIAKCLRKRKLTLQQQTSVTQNTNCRTQSIDLRQKSDEDTEQHTSLFTRQRISVNTSTTCEPFEKSPLYCEEPLHDSGLFSSAEGLQATSPELT